MTRSIPPTLAPVLEQPLVVTNERLRELVAEAGVATPTHVVTQRLAERGWLLPSGVRGVWEFAPAAHAGPHSHNDPWLVLRSERARDANLAARIALGSALWTLDVADRAPDRGEISLPSGVKPTAALSRTYRTVHFDAILDPAERNGLLIDRAETVLVHLAHRPAAVRSWAGILDSLPRLVADIGLTELERELEPRPQATHVRLAYLLSGVAPHIAKHLRIRPAGKVWFGPRRALRRHNARWNVADTMLPYAPDELRPHSLSS